ncbi:hypothetical protein Z948_3272 [Sulfitobacter donghicola DSW-25 = KCTC 12864 = JCM 14565]|uniref:Uncharacterized protein n=1 Tax=Sulfitobacter donghicola DSW-25 = KCTC 12864 = JCM 14565 TaxID=1300350 RepID=A0A073IEZ8_9RHOB|nr:hypothetical protein DSW25_04150 [Sulfitobacter donghicola DSW-25 = KCTC 12864 = JCM 14565]KIN69526.1 hypothetical protein Z948_3272 [Sulfitobacter donghicola DSW-25 = KCTC 12864 = JCM 14565]
MEALMVLQVKAMEAENRCQNPIYVGMSMKYDVLKRPIE